MRRFLIVLLLLVSSLLPCGLWADGCDEAGPVGCSHLCHLGCSQSPVPLASFRVEQIQPLPYLYAAASADRLLLQSPSPELPPPRA
jgi:hypothetical protein